MCTNWEIRVRGLVQGVGFRPFVWHLAKEAELSGEVLNDSEGVIIRLACTDAQLEVFQTALNAGVPPLARIDAVEVSPIVSSVKWSKFSIVASEQGKISTGIVPDAATCKDCLDDVSDPTNRRYGYAFTNCTNCGPRLSITRAIPYDRANTAMASFKMCHACQSEYDDPADRRFHAQPNACPDCGPQLKLVDVDGVTISENPIAAAAQALSEGKIVAIKGLGGFQLAVDAGNNTAVDTLRARKRRPSKPLALMARDITDVMNYVRLDTGAEKMLSSAQAPIVLAKISGKPLAKSIAPNQNRLGFMLPNTPIHHLLLLQLDRPIVLTSGNLSNEPQETDNDAALEKLAGIANLWLMHDRGIVNRLDDSVVQIVEGVHHNLRRARGFAPAPLRLHEGFSSAPPILAVGADLKNTFCLLKDGQAIVSQHMGDMENAETQRDFHANLDLYRRIYEFTPSLVATDLHPEYYSTRLGQDIAARQEVDSITVQHHHAHIASVLAEYGYGPETKPVLGIVLDGLGYGGDGAIWGGEFLLADYKVYDRLAHFNPVPLLGGDKANKQPWRNLLAHLYVAFGTDALDKLPKVYGALSVFAALKGKATAMMAQLFNQQLNAPLASSAGRLFDAVAAMLGLSFDQIQFEGQAAMKLQVLAESCPDDLKYYPVLPTKNIQWRPLWEGILQDKRAGIPDASIAKRFHNTLIEVIGLIATELSKNNKVDTVVLTGGVFQNSLLLGGVQDRLTANNLMVLTPSTFPANDGGLALGQSVIAAARWNCQKKPN